MSVGDVNPLQDDNSATFCSNGISEVIDSLPARCWMRHTLSTRRLRLVLDLDHTLINAVKVADDSDHDVISLENFLDDDGKPELYRFVMTGSLAGSYYIKLRPHVRSFLKEMSQYYELSLYTNAIPCYLDIALAVLDPDGSLFGRRLMCNTDPTTEGWIKHSQLLYPDWTPFDCQFTLVLDDRWDVWGSLAENVLKAIKFDFLEDIGLRFIFCEGYDSGFVESLVDSDDFLRRIKWVMVEIYNRVFDNVEKYPETFFNWSPAGNGERTTSETLVAMGETTTPGVPSVLVEIKGERFGSYKIVPHGNWWDSRETLFPDECLIWLAEWRRQLKVSKCNLVKYVGDEEDESKNPCRYDQVILGSEEVLDEEEINQATHVIVDNYPESRLQEAVNRINNKRKENRDNGCSTQLADVQVVTTGWLWHCFCCWRAPDDIQPPDSDPGKDSISVDESLWDPWGQFAATNIKSVWNGLAATVPKPRTKELHEIFGNTKDFLFFGTSERSREFHIQGPYGLTISLAFCAERSLRRECMWVDGQAAPPYDMALHTCQDPSSL